MRTLLGALLAVSLVAAGCAETVTGPHARGAGTAAAQSPAAVIDVSVATIWTKPRLLRALDAPSAANPADLRSWLAGMTTADRRWLVGKLRTQATYGTKVSVLERDGAWTKVAVHGQPTQLNRLGYPGWLPTRQLTADLSLPTLLRTKPVAIVKTRTAWLRMPGTWAPRLEISFGTRLPIVGESGSYFLVATPTGGELAVAKDAVARYASLSAIPKPTGRRIVATAKRFLGLPYLWAGTSGFGYDCSGLTYMVYRRFGIAMPRDADRQALHGAPVARSRLRLGDLVFFAGPGGTGRIHHVGIYAGGGMMVDSPRTGAAVRVAPLSSFGSEYAGARRYL